MWRKASEKKVVFKEEWFLIRVFHRMNEHELAVEPVDRRRNISWSLEECKERFHKNDLKRGVVSFQGVSPREQGVPPREQGVPPREQARFHSRTCLMGPGHNLWENARRGLFFFLLLLLFLMVLKEGWSLITVFLCINKQELTVEPVDGPQNMVSWQM